MARQSIPTANATSGRVCVEQYSREPTSDWYEMSKFGSMVREGLLRSASSTSLGSVSDAGVRVLWKESGTPSGRYVVTRCAMYLSSFRITQDSSVVMSTLIRSETGPSSSTFQRRVRASTNSEYNESGSSCVKREEVVNIESERQCLLDAIH
eukprot:563780-Pleurochrysis_carterae.AAC.1